LSVHSLHKSGGTAEDKSFRPNSWDEGSFYIL